MPAVLRRFIKRLIQYYFYLKGCSGIGSEKPMLIVLMYHRVLPSFDSRYRLEQPGMIVEPDTFIEHLSILGEHFELTSINDWISTPENERPMGISCAITFDDGWSDNYTYAFPHLQSTKTPATIFLVTDLINTHKQFWPERLAYLLHIEAQHRDLELFNTEEWSWLLGIAKGIRLGKTDPDPIALDIIISNCKSLGEAEIYRRLDAMDSTLPTTRPQSADVLNWEQIREMRSEGLIDFGSHTRKHTRMTKIEGAQELKYEIVDSKRILEKNIGQPVTIFCYPNGDITDASEQLVRKTYKGAVTTKSGINKVGDDPFRIKRIAIHQDESYDRIAFLARIYRFMRR